MIDRLCSAALLAGLLASANAAAEFRSVGEAAAILYDAPSTKAQKLFVNIQNLVLGDPNVAILSSVDQPIIEPDGSGHEKTYLRVVAKPSSMFNQLVLPIQVVEKKGGA